MSEDSAAGGSETILLAEDDINLGFVISDHLEQHGFSVDLYENGEDALNGFQASNYDICVLDIMMPKMNGIEVCRKVKQELKINDVFIIILTAKGQELDKQKGKDVEADVYMTKPFDPDELLERARAVLNL